MSDSFITLAEAFRYEPERTKGSRFIADLAPVSSKEQALAFIEEIRQTYPDASHHCFAWSIGMKGEESRANDDGEPGGSAGRPILAQIEGHGVTGVVCVVTRYFGGTKLGVGGLMRAYGGACGQGLDRAPLIEKPITQRWLLRFPYECSGVVEGVLHNLGVTLQEAEYGEAVEGAVVVSRTQGAELVGELNERTGGRAEVIKEDGDAPQ